jgi:hypothetical protein
LIGIITHVHPLADQMLVRIEIEKMVAGSRIVPQAGIRTFQPEVSLEERMGGLVNTPDLSTGETGRRVRIGYAPGTRSAFGSHIVLKRRTQRFHRDNTLSPRFGLASAAATRMAPPANASGGGPRPILSSRAAQAVCIMVCV